MDPREWQRRRQRTQVRSIFIIALGWLVMGVLYDIGHGDMKVFILGGLAYIALVVLLLEVFHVGRYIDSALDRLFRVSRS